MLYTRMSVDAMNENMDPVEKRMSTRQKYVSILLLCRRFRNRVLVNDVHRRVRMRTVKKPPRPHACCRRNLSHEASL